MSEMPTAFAVLMAISVAGIAVYSVGAFIALWCRITLAQHEFWMRVAMYGIGIYAVALLGSMAVA